jgi:hypothetical protein
MLRKHSAGLIAAGLMLAAALATGLAAGPADAAAAHSTMHTARAMNLAGDPSGSCGIWTDGTTFGIKCTGFSGWDYQAQATCKNGQTAAGPYRAGTSGDWSYAYCSTYDSTINYANTIFVPTGANVGSTIQAAPAGKDPSGSCQVWSDGTTFGIACTGFSGWSYYTAVTCVNGHTTAGPRENGTSGKWSYAYCSTYNSTINVAYPYFSPFTI